MHPKKDFFHIFPRIIPTIKASKGPNQKSQEDQNLELKTDWNNY